MDYIPLQRDSITLLKGPIFPYIPFQRPYIGVYKFYIGVIQLFITSYSFLLLFYSLWYAQAGPSRAGSCAYAVGLGGVVNFSRKTSDQAWGPKREYKDLFGNLYRK